MTAPRSDALAASWLEHHPSSAKDRWSHSELDEAAQEDPENTWGAILQLVQQDLTDEQLAVLAAGPLEVLLSYHGPAFIDRVEQEAATNKRFDNLLGGVWQLSMSDDIWSRVQKARRAAW
ncbi:MAG TPA: hypothetical protein VIW07_13350 [Candidatus Udaeobacter sp.]|jgi:hypothetical protein